MKVSLPFNFQLSNEKRDVGTTYTSVDAWIESLGTAGTSVTYQQAMGISAYWAAVKAISGDIASVEFNIMQKIGPRYKIAFDHPITQLMQYGPNQLQTRFNFFELLLHDILVFGTAYEHLVRTQSGRVASIEPLSPTKTKVKKIINPQLEQLPYLYEDESQTPSRRLDGRDVWHVVGFGGSHLQGASTLETFGRLLGFSLSIDSYGRAFFDNSGRPSGTLTSPVEDLSDEEVQLIKKAWNSANSGMNAQGTAILWNNFKYQTIGVAPEHAQFLDTKVQMVREVSRIFNIPTTKLRDTERSTYSNVEQEAIDYVLETLTPLARRLEQSFTKKLLSDSQGEFYAKFTLGSLLMGDVRTRFQAYEIAVEQRIMTVEEVRHMEGLPTRPVGASASDVPVEDESSALQRLEDEIFEMGVK